MTQVEKKYNMTLVELNEAYSEALVANDKDKEEELMKALINAWAEKYGY